MTSFQKKIESRIKAARLFFLDLDGTVYLGEALLPGAKQFIGYLREQHRRFVFLTNNSSQNAADYFHKLVALGIPATIENVFTSGQATGIFISRKKPGARLYVVGTRSLVRELASYGLVISDGNGAVDYVVVGFDRELTYEKIQTACELIGQGAGYIATNPDFVCPVGEGKSIPDCGSICFMIEQATGKKPHNIGKPQTEMVDIICRKFNVTKDKAVIIGDRLYTDIMLGRNSGIFTVCVLSGESKPSDIRRSKVKPHCTVRSISELNHLFR
jgi:4-nitrophenyl phosphatase